MGKLFIRPYSVALRQYPALPLRDRLIAQDRFASSIENLLGGVDGVLAVFRATGMGDEIVPAGLGRDVALERWAAAAQSARVVGLRGLAAVAGAYFEIELGHDGTALADDARAEAAGGREQTGGAALPAA